MFLGFETRNAHMHVAVTAVFDRGPLGVPGGGIDVERIRAHLASKLPHVRRFRQRLGYVPFARDAVWVDDDAFDLRCHVRHASLPRPGSNLQLQQRCAEILERPLNRKRPLWEAWIIEGLAEDAWALLVKVHHCIVDGVAGIGMLAALLDTDAAETVRVPEPWRARPAPWSDSGGGAGATPRWRANAAIFWSARRSASIAAARRRRSSATGSACSPTQRFRQTSLSVRSRLAPPPA